MIVKNFNFYFFIFIHSILLFAVFHLYKKHLVGNDSSISEWIINYQGGFTRRGLPGEIAFHLAKTFDLKLRFVIFLFQSFFYSLYLLLIYYFFRNVRINTIILFAIFTPIFLIYHIAELEVLERKEIFLFIGYIWFYNISKKKNDVRKSILWVFFILPIVSVLYEPSIFYYSFFAATIIIKMRNDKITKIILTIILIFIPSLVVSWFSAFALITAEGFEIMKNSLSENFGETCYMSCQLMSSKKETLVHLNTTINKLTEAENSLFIYLFRYFMIMLVGCGPLLILIKNSTFNISLFNFKRPALPFLILNIIVPIHWLMFVDWGRAVNITYVSSLLFFFYLYKNDLIKINFKNIQKKLDPLINFVLEKTFFKSKKFFVTFVFVIYAFGWSPPTLLSADVNSIPGYRIPYKTIKYLLFR